MQRLLQHFGAEEVGEDAHAAEEDAGAQVVEHEDPGEDQAVLAQAVMTSVAAAFDEPVQQREDNRAERQEIDPPAAAGEERLLQLEPQHAADLAHPELVHTVAPSAPIRY